MRWLGLGGFIPGQGAPTGNPGALPRPQWLRPPRGWAGGSWRGKTAAWRGFTPPCAPRWDQGRDPNPRHGHREQLGSASTSAGKENPRCPLTWTPKNGSRPHPLSLPPHPDGSSPSPEHPARDKAGLQNNRLKSQAGKPRSLLCPTPRASPEPPCVPRQGGDTALGHPRKGFSIPDPADSPSHRRPGRRRSISCPAPHPCPTPSSPSFEPK